MFVPRRAWGANDRLAYGLIGAGGRGRYLNSNFQKLGARVRRRRAKCTSRTWRRRWRTRRTPRSYVDYHELLGQAAWMPW